MSLYDDKLYDDSLATSALSESTTLWTDYLSVKTNGRA